MGRGARARPFIDKKTATTYSLVFRSAEDSTAAGGDDAPPERALVDARAGVRIGVPDAAAVAAAGPAPDRGPLAWLAAEEGPPAGLPAERRRELLELGFPDDGYDYGKHMRAPGGLAQGDTSLEGAPAGDDGGPSVFVAAASVAAVAPDVRVDDATRLTLHETAPDDDAAAAAAAGVTAFSRRVAARPRKGALAAAVAEVAARLEAQELDDGDDDVSIGGSLQDDFVLAAAAAPSTDGEGVSDDDDGSASDDDDTCPSDASWASSGGDAPTALPTGFGGDGGSAPHPPASRRAGSIASTYWRPERTDRPPALADVDAAFEAVALQYDSDEIGELDDLADAGELDAGLRKEAGVYDRVFDQFLAAHATRDHAHEGGQHYVAAISAVGEDDAAAATVEVARAAMARARLEEEAADARADDDADDPPDAHPRYPPSLPDREPAWDCETVLSLAPSTASTCRPSVLGEPARRRRTRPATLLEGGLLDQMTLSRKTGMPLGAGSTVNAVPAAAAPRTPQQPVRRPGETADEKKARKAAVKEARREARATKKETAALLKEAQGSIATRKAVPRVEGVHIA